MCDSFMGNCYLLVLFGAGGTAPSRRYIRAFTSRKVRLSHCQALFASIYHLLYNQEKSDQSTPEFETVQVFDSRRKVRIRMLPLIARVWLKPLFSNPVTKSWI